MHVPIELFLQQPPVCASRQSEAGNAVVCKGSNLNRHVSNPASICRIDLSDKDDDDEVKGQSTISQRCAPTNPLVLHKCLEMLFQLMQDPQIKTLNATLMSLLEEFIMPSIAHLEAEIRKVAVQALTVFSLRSIEVARQNLPLLFQVTHGMSWTCFFQTFGPGQSRVGSS